MIIWVESSFEEYWQILLPSALLIAAPVIYFARLPSQRRALAKLLLERRPFRDFTSKAETVRICRTLATLLRTGVPLQSALSSVLDVARNDLVRSQLEIAINRVSTGERLAIALKCVSALDAQSVQMIAVGEEANKLESMLTHVADTQEANLSQGIERLMTVLTPLLTIAIGTMIGGFILSVMRAILSVNDVALS
jgi:type II secretory pathway component PulF